MLLKVHNSYRTVVAICDSELIGKTFNEGEKQLELRESFYGGDTCNELDSEELEKAINYYVKEDATFNIVGKKSVQVALKLGIISKEGIKYVSGVPFALVLL